MLARLTCIGLNYSNPSVRGAYTPDLYIVGKIPRPLGRTPPFSLHPSPFMKGGYRGIDSYILDSSLALQVIPRPPMRPPPLSLHPSPFIKGGYRGINFSFL